MNCGLLPPHPRDLPIPLFEGVTSDYVELEIEPVEAETRYPDDTIPYGIKDKEEMSNEIEHPRAFELDDETIGIDHISCEYDTVQLIDDAPVKEIEALNTVRTELNADIIFTEDDPTMQKIMDDHTYARLVEKYIAKDREVKTLDKSQLFDNILHFANNAEDRPKILHIWLRLCSESAFIEILERMVFSLPTVSSRRTLLRIETRDSFKSIRPLVAKLMKLKDANSLKVTCESVYASCRSKTKGEKWIRAEDRFGQFHSHEQILKEIPFSYVTTFRIVDEHNKPDQAVEITYEDEAIVNEWKEFQGRRTNINVDHLTNIPKSLFPDGVEMFSSVTEFELTEEKQMVSTRLALDQVHNFAQILQMYNKWGQ